MDKKALRFTIIGFLSIATVVAGIFFTTGFINKNNEEKLALKNEEITVKSDEEISHTDAEEVKMKASKIFAGLAEFGYQVEPEERNAILQSSENSFITRQQAFESVKEEISGKSSLNFSVDKLNNLSNDFELAYFVRYQLKDIAIELDNNYSSSTITGNTHVKTIKGQVRVESKVSYAQPDGSENMDWDGTYKVYERDFINNIQATFVQDEEGNWTLYQIKGAEHPWILAIDGEPNINKYYENILKSNFKNVGSYKTEVPESQSMKPDSVE